MRASTVVVLGLVLVIASGADALIAQEGSDRELRGVVVAADTGEPVAGAWISSDGAVGTYSKRDGSFYMERGPAGSYQVDALGYRAASTTLDPGAPANVIELAPDPTTHEGLARVHDELRARRNRAGGVRVYDREWLAFANERTLGHFLSGRGLEPAQTICLDDVPGGVIALSWEPHELYLVEALDRGRVLRLYTEEHIAHLASTGEGLSGSAEAGRC